jgi:hypothetical protein
MAEEDRVIFHCRGCGRTGESSRDLLAQGCEGTHERYIPESAIEREQSVAHDLYSALDRLVEAADQAEAFRYDASALSDARTTLRRYGVYDERDPLSRTHGTSTHRPNERMRKIQGDRDRNRQEIRDKLESES